MKLNEFLAAEFLRLLRFRRLWLARHQDDAGAYPLDVGGVADWLEQLDITEDGEDESGAKAFVLFHDPSAVHGDGPGWHVLRAGGEVTSFSTSEEADHHIRKALLAHLEGLPVCEDCPIGGQDGSGPVCPRAELCDLECAEQVHAMANEGRDDG